MMCGNNFFAKSHKSHWYQQQIFDWLRIAEPIQIQLFIVRNWDDYTNIDFYKELVDFLLIKRVVCQVIVNSDFVLMRSLNTEIEFVITL